MDFGLSDPQSLLRRAAAAHLQQHAPLERVRRIMESPLGHDRELLRGLGDQGLIGILVPERHGGSGLGLLDATVVAQEIGRAAAPVSFHASAVAAPLVLLECGSDAQQAEWLPRIAAGDALVAPAAPALGASAPGSPPSETTGAGDLLYVPDAAVADAFLVEHRGALALVRRTAPGLRVMELANVDDTRRLGELDLRAVAGSDREPLPGSSRAALERCLQAARIALVADALGACQRALQLAVEYALRREQFGRVIGSFQAVKHLCAEIAADVDPVQSLLWYAAYVWDERKDEAGWLVPLLKAHASEVGTDAVTKATQVFGGMGFTWECDVHLFFKRVGYARQVLGRPEALRAEAALLQYGPLASGGAG